MSRIHRSFREASITFFVTIIGPSHFVVKFVIDETICVVPRKNIVSSSVPSVGDDCEVKWSDGEILTAVVMAAGKSKRMSVYDDDSFYPF